MSGRYRSITQGTVSGLMTDEAVTNALSSLATRAPLATAGISAYSGCDSICSLVSSSE